MYQRKTDKDHLGRPKKYRTKRMELKLTVEEAKLLRECTEITGENRTDVIVSGLELLHNKLTSIKNK